MGLSRSLFVRNIEWDDVSFDKGSGPIHETVLECMRAVCCSSGVSPVAGSSCGANYVGGFDCFLRGGGLYFSVFTRGHALKIGVIIFVVGGKSSAQLLLDNILDEFEGVVTLAVESERTCQETGVEFYLPEFTEEPRGAAGSGDSVCPDHSDDCPEWVDPKSCHGCLTPVSLLPGQEHCPECEGRRYVPLNTLLGKPDRIGCLACKATGVKRSGNLQLQDMAEESFSKMKSDSETPDAGEDGIIDCDFIPLDEIPLVAGKSNAEVKEDVREMLSEFPSSVEANAPCFEDGASCAGCPDGGAITKEVIDFVPVSHKDMDDRIASCDVVANTPEASDRLVTCGTCEGSGFIKTGHPLPAPCRPCGTSGFVSSKGKAPRKSYKCDLCGDAGIVASVFDGMRLREIPEFYDCPAGCKVPVSTSGYVSDGSPVEPAETTTVPEGTFCSVVPEHPNCDGCEHYEICTVREREDEAPSSPETRVEFNSAGSLSGSKAEWEKIEAVAKPVIDDMRGKTPEEIACGRKTTETSTHCPRQITKHRCAVCKGDDCDFPLPVPEASVEGNHYPLAPAPFVEVDGAVRFSTEDPPEIVKSAEAWSGGSGSGSQDDTPIKITEVEVQNGM